MPAPSSGFGECRKHYEILNNIGKGGFASVYRAKCLISGSEVAIKMIDIKQMRSLGMLKRIRQEVSIHSRLKHPSILELYAYFEDSNYVYLVLEMCHKGELQRYFKEQTSSKFLEEQGVIKLPEEQGAFKLTEEHAGHIIRQVAGGVKYLHSHNIVHRDLSLSNLLLTKDMQVKIADFGLASELEDKDKKCVTMCGTPNFISPEVATSSPYSFETDVWALGCMLFTLLSGKPPFDSNAVKSTLTKIVMKDFVMPKGISENAKDLINKTLNKNQDARIRLSDLLRHPFLTSIENTKVYGKKKSISSDSGVGSSGQMSSNGHLRLRSRSEERTSYAPVLPVYNGRGSTLSARSEPLRKKMLSNQAKYFNSYQGENSVLYGIPRPPKSTVFSRVNLDSGCQTQENEDAKFQKQKSKEREPNSEKADQNGSNKLPVSPLNSRRLLPARHKTKGAVLTILENGEVCIEFLKKKGLKEKVSDICRISNDGLRIVLYKVDNQEIGSSPLPLPLRGADQIYSYESLPQQYHKKYLYAARFIKLVKAKTPKLTIYTPKSKCLFMENGPDPDCELHFYDGVKVLRVDKILRLQHEGKTYEQAECPSNLEDCLTHFLDWYKQCQILEANLTSLETATGFSYFPAIIGRRPMSALNDSTYSRGKENMSTASQPVIPSFSASCSVVSTVDSRSRKLNSMQSSTETNKVMVPNIGMATQFSSGDIRIDYNDGSALTMSPRSIGGGIIYESSNGNVTKYLNNQQNPDVPFHVREKLKHMPTVIKYFVQPKNKFMR